MYELGDVNNTIALRGTTIYWNGYDVHIMGEIQCESTRQQATSLSMTGRVVARMSLSPSECWSARKEDIFYRPCLRICRMIISEVTSSASGGQEMFVKSVYNAALTAGEMLMLFVYIQMLSSPLVARVSRKLALRIVRGDLVVTDVGTLVGCELQAWDGQIDDSHSIHNRHPPGRSRCISVHQSSRMSLTGSWEEGRHISRENK